MLDSDKSLDGDKSFPLDHKQGSAWGFIVRRKTGRATPHIVKRKDQLPYTSLYQRRFRALKMGSMISKT
jgi:hypothetical protein